MVKKQYRKYMKNAVQKTTFFMYPRVLGFRTYTIFVKHINLIILQYY